jgi:hypothetical protein
VKKAVSKKLKKIWRVLGMTLCVLLLPTPMSAWAASSTWDDVTLTIADPLPQAAGGQGSVEKFLLETPITLPSPFTYPADKGDVRELIVTEEATATVYVTSKDIGYIASNFNALVSLDMTDAAAAQPSYISGDLLAPLTNLNFVSLPEGVTWLQEGAFADFSSLVTIILPESLASIDAYMFSRSGNLKVVEFTGSNPPAAIDEHAFDSFPAGATVRVPKGREDAYREKLPSAISALLPSVVGLDVSPATFDGAGGDVVATVHAANLWDDDRVQVIAKSGSTERSEDAEISADGATATATLTLPANLTSSAVTYLFTVKLNNVEIPISVASAEVTVTGAGVIPPAGDVTAVTLNKTNLYVEYGYSGALTATVLPNTATNKAVTWASDNYSVAGVTPRDASNAVISGNALGTAKITVTTVNNAKKATSTVTVRDNIIESVLVTPVKLTYAPGEKIDIDVVLKRAVPDNKLKVEITGAPIFYPAISNLRARQTYTLPASGVYSIAVTATDGDGLEYWPQTASLVASGSSGENNGGGGGCSAGTAGMMAALVVLVSAVIKKKSR